jgi:hypothetical protein
LFCIRLQVLNLKAFNMGCWTVQTPIGSVGVEDKCT